MERTCLVTGGSGFVGGRLIGSAKEPFSVAINNGTRTKSVECR